MRGADHHETPVIVLPGFGSGDRVTAPLRQFLKRSGYQAEGWGLGVNRAGIGLIEDLDDLSEHWPIDRSREHRGEASVPALCDRMAARVLQRSQDLGRPVALIGWSLGGYVAREVARDLPEQVACVITMGSPVVGGPKYTAAARFFRRLGQDLDWIEAEVQKRNVRPITQPITAIYSKSDAVVSWAAALDHDSPRVTHIEVNAAHMGMAFNPQIWGHVERALAGGND